MPIFQLIWCLLNYWRIIIFNCTALLAISLILFVAYMLYQLFLPSHSAAQYSYHQVQLSNAKDPDKHTSFHLSSNLIEGRFLSEVTLNCCKTLKLGHFIPHFTVLWCNWVQMTYEPICTHFISFRQRCKPKAWHTRFYAVSDKIDRAMNQPQIN